MKISADELKDLYAVAGVEIAQDILKANREMSALMSEILQETGGHVKRSRRDRRKSKRRGRSLY